MFSHLKGMSLRELKDAAIEQQNAMDASYVFIIALTVKSMHSFLRVTFQSSVFFIVAANFLLSAFSIGIVSPLNGLVIPIAKLAKLTVSEEVDVFSHRKILFRKWDVVFRVLTKSIYLFNFLSDLADKQATPGEDQKVHEHQQLSTYAYFA